MLILGDFATYRDDLVFKGAQDNDLVLLNCEGFLTDEIEPDSFCVFNNVNLYGGLSLKYNLILNLSNNHTMDIKNGISKSLFLAEKYGIQTVGGGFNLKDACKPHRCTEDGVELAVIAAGWDIIGCKAATANSEGVSPLEETWLLKAVSEEKKNGRKVVVYLHWGYELEVYPQPTHRNLAKQLIDHGADLIVGCHSHCLQGFEKYNNKYIFYGLGNSVFDEEYYFNGKLKFPEFCKIGLAMQWDVKTNGVLVSKTLYKGDTLVFNGFTEPENDNELMKLSTFSKLNHVEYIDFFKKNRRKKNLLPIFHEMDITVSYKLKKAFLNLRAFIIKKMFLLGLKGHSR